MASWVPEETPCEIFGEERAEVELEGADEDAVIDEPAVKVDMEVAVADADVAVVDADVAMVWLGKDDTADILGADGAAKEVAIDAGNVEPPNTHPGPRGI